MNYITAKKNCINFDRVYLYLMIFFAFIIPLSRATITFFIILFVAVWLFEGDFQRKYRQIKSSKILLSIALLFGLLFTSLLFSSDLQNALNIFRLYGYWLLIFIIATSIKKEYISKVITAFLFGMLTSETIAYGVFFDLWSFSHATKEYLSPFMMHIDYSVFLAFTAVILFNRLLSGDYSKKEKLLILIFFCSTTMNLFLSIGRTGQIALVFGIFTLFVLYFKISFKAIFFSAITLVVLFFMAYNISYVFEKRVLQAKNDIERIVEGDMESSLGIRAGYWLVAMDIFKNNPIFGVGIGDYKIAVKQTLQESKYNAFPPTMKQFMIDSHLHNQYLMVLVQMGIIGILAILIIIYFIISSIRFIDGEFKNISILFLAIYLVSSHADPLWYKQFTLVLWVFIIGMIVYFEIDKNFKNDLKVA